MNLTDHLVTVRVLFQLHDLPQTHKDGRRIGNIQKQLLERNRDLELALCNI